MNYYTTKKKSGNELLLIKGLSPNSLDNLQIDTVNSNIKKKLKYFKNQIPPKFSNNNKDNYIDELFPPNNDSILGLKNGVPVEKIEERLKKSQMEFPFDVDNIIWLRASEIFNYQHYSIFVNDISIDDVRQGYLGNCYLMSSLAAMTNIPQLICQLFRSFQLNKNGCFEIGLNIEGEWQIVLLDDYFPCSKKTRVPIFAKPNGPELWVMLLEKAWAKINGSYLNIIGGYASEVLSVFTSFPNETFDLFIKDIDLIWKELKKAFEDGHIITCCSKFDNEIEKFGLVSGHTFTVTNLVEGFVNKKYTRLIKLRNPWGYKEWIGDWSDHSKLWTEEAKKN
jgi:calpain-15